MPCPSPPNPFFMPPQAQRLPPKKSLSFNKWPQQGGLNSGVAWSPAYVYPWQVYQQPLPPGFPTFQVPNPQKPSANPLMKLAHQKSSGNAGRCLEATHPAASWPRDQNQAFTWLSQVPTPGPMGVPSVGQSLRRRASWTGKERLMDAHRVPVGVNPGSDGALQHPHQVPIAAGFPGALDHAGQASGIRTQGPGDAAHAGHLRTAVRSPEKPGGVDFGSDGSSGTEQCHAAWKDPGDGTRPVAGHQGITTCRVQGVLSMYMTSDLCMKGKLYYGQVQGRKVAVPYLPPRAYLMRTTLAYQRHTAQICI
eukprot:jgi/Botrbrau1/23513/Bobra.106_1s0063.1